MFLELYQAIGFALAQGPSELLCGSQEWWSYLLHELCFSAAVHAAVNPKDAACGARVVR